ncbi:MAG: single-stranded DNA-binding protein [Gemmatimonadetes bacterium]|jgi:single-strand selective monofunctional uracil DNA glycosylase|nr:single-stranded DNA-binding protein [Gemmatimonadota bacterium]HCK09052.1 single-stranded DNA-binding protein [Candidatus Latescibacterota bacterium]
MQPLTIVRRLSKAVRGLSFQPPVSHVYNPLEYALDAHRTYLDRYCRSGIDALLIGMNPGPWGMVQTGVPFGEVELVRDWMGIQTGVEKPKQEHPKRLIEGFSCQRSEVSGRRLWGWARDRFGSPEAFFDRFFVWNYCPLAFMEESGRNRTPDKLPPDERNALYAPCDKALSRIVANCRPGMILGVGKFAESRAKDVLGDNIPIGTVLHPSPASPIANRGWSEQAEKQLADLGLLD